MGERYRQVPDEVMVCMSCRMTVLAKGDWKGWRGIQMDPREPVLSWFCNKQPCQEKREQAMADAMETWRRAHGGGENG